jgi:hypothetical protein
MAAARSRLAIALAAVGIAIVACFGGDHGSARAAVGNATGPLIGSPLAGAAILSANGMAPGDVRIGYIDVANIGDTAGTFALGAIGLTETPLARELDLDVRDVTAGRTSTVVYSGKLASLSSVVLGDMPQGDAHRYRFSVSLPSDADDSYQGASSSVTFLWSATAPEPAPTPPSSTTTPGTAATPARATTAQAPPKATTAGGTVKSGAIVTAPARQTAKAGKVTATVACVDRCKIDVSGTAVVGSVKVKLKPVTRTLTKGKRLSVTVTLPPAARLALAAGRPVTLRLSVRAKVGTRVVTVRRTVRVMPASR